MIFSIQDYILTEMLMLVQKIILQSFLSLNPENPDPKTNPGSFKPGFIFIISYVVPKKLSAAALAAFRIV